MHQAKDTVVLLRSVVATPVLPVRQRATSRMIRVAAFVRDCSTGSSADCSRIGCAASHVLRPANQPAHNRVRRFLILRSGGRFERIARLIFFVYVDGRSHHHHFKLARNSANARRSSAWIFPSNGGIRASGLSFEGLFKNAINQSTLRSGLLATFARSGP